MSHSTKVHPATGAPPPPPPGPKGVPLLGNFLQIQGDRPNCFVTLQRHFGDVVRVTVGPRALYLVSHPDGVKHVMIDNHRNYVKGRSAEKLSSFLGEGLLTSEGEFWLRQRRLAQPAFHRHRLEGFAATMTEATRAMLDQWATRYADSGQPFDLMGELVRLILPIVCDTLFGSTVTDEDFRTIAEVSEILGPVTDKRARLPFDIERLPLPENRAYDEAVARLDRIIYRIIEARRQSGEERDDLLGMLMAARDEESNEQMSDQQLRDEVVTLFLAGYDTTVNLLGWLWYLLSQHVAERRRLQAEVDAVLGGRVPTVADLPRLTYTRQVIDETLRLYPTAWFLGREPLADDTIGGYHIEAGSTVAIMPYVIHRRAELWPNPEGFDPDRFAPDAPPPAKYAYLPFGAGARLCIGSQFALMEATLIVAMMAQRFTLDLVPGHPVEPLPLITLKPHPAVMMTLHSRPEATR